MAAQTRRPQPRPSPRPEPPISPPVVDIPPEVPAPVEPDPAPPVASEPAGEPPMVDLADPQSGQCIRGILPGSGYTSVAIGIRSFEVDPDTDCILRERF